MNEMNADQMGDISPGEVFLGMNTPWGRADRADRVAPGIGFVATPGHGGAKLDRIRNAKVPAPLRQRGGWYEEDVDMAIVFYFFADEVHAYFARFNPYTDRAKMIADARWSIGNWMPDEYAAVFGEPVAEADSYILRKRAFHLRHSEDWIVITARGFGAPGVPEGWVGVFAKKGGRDAPYSAESVGGHFLVPESEYARRGPFGFVIDPARHIPWDGEPDA